MNTLSQILQVIIALGLFNVWLLRFGRSTPYRGGKAESMREEFAVYGLSVYMMYLVGTLKVLVAVSMIAGIWVSSVILPSAVILILLMLGAFAMHIKIKDPIMKAVPSLLMLAMATVVVVIHMTISR